MTFVGDEGTPAEGAGEPLDAGQCDEDIDGALRDSPPDVGADER